MRRRIGRSHKLCSLGVIFMVFVGHLEAVILKIHQFAAVYRGLSQRTQQNGIEEIGQVDALGGHNCSVRW